MKVIQAIICRRIQHCLTPTIIETIFILVTDRSVLALFHLNLIVYAGVCDDVTVSRIYRYVTPVLIEKCLIVINRSI